MERRVQLELVIDKGHVCRHLFVRELVLVVDPGDGLSNLAVVLDGGELEVGCEKVTVKEGG